MEVIRQALLPTRRITQIYTDTKKSYDQLIVQERVNNPQVSSLHKKLRIQKDRLTAWGIEWADTNAQQGDIDNSLDRAGISDLVASIMTSIKDLLDDAEKVQPSFQPPGRLPDQKGGFLSMPNRQWTSEDLARLDDLVKDITTSIDTLCDLSRSTQTIRRDSSLGSKKKSMRFSQSPIQSAEISRSHTPAPKSPTRSSFALSGASDLVNSTRVDPSRLRFPSVSTTLGPSPPPDYNAVTASPDNRKLATLRSEYIRTPISTQSYSETPVLVDFGYKFDESTSLTDLPALKRYECLLLALQAADHELDDTYTGCLRIMGWFVDITKSRFAFIYDIPQPSPAAHYPTFASGIPVTLLSFLHHSGSTDSENTPSLEDRYKLASNLLANLLHTHAKGVTHRHINSNNIIFIQQGPVDSDRKPWKEGIIRKPYLVSWDQSDQDVDHAADEMHVPRLYRHPESTIGKRSNFKQAYDIYSLGLVLLEIGLWMPLHKMFKTKYSSLRFRHKLRTTYAHKLAGKCGSAYMKVVDYCLHAADMETPASSSHRLSRDFHQTKRQEDFYWKALKPLERCCLIDESNEPVLHPFPSMAPPQGGQAEAAELLASSTFTDAKEDQPEERLEADSPHDDGLTYDVLVWSYEIPSDVRSYYSTTMLPKLNKMLARAINRWESYTIMTFMAGDSPETAKPTIYMSCLSVFRAWKILEYVNKDQQYFDIKVSVGQTCFSKAGKNRRRRRKNVASPIASRQNSTQTSTAQSRYQRKPSCGASISAFVDEQHLERATFGGIVLADGEPFGMSVHHMLEDQDQDQGLEFILDSEAEDIQTTTSGQYPHPHTSNHDADQLPPAAPTYKRTTYPQDFDFDPSILDQDFGDEDEDLYTMGDTLGIPPGHGRDKVVTQPALDDVDPAFFPNEEDKSDEHLSSHSLGYIHASSGRKQVRHGDNGIAHEVDWALLKVADHRLETTNVVEGANRFCGTAVGEQRNGVAGGPSPCRILAADALGARDVHAIGATSGLGDGTILPTMVMQKMPGRVFSSTVWRFRGQFGGELPSFLTPFPHHCNISALARTCKLIRNSGRRLRRLDRGQQHWCPVRTRHRLERPRRIRHPRPNGSHVPRHGARTRETSLPALQKRRRYCCEGKSRELCHAAYTCRHSHPRGGGRGCRCGDGEWGEYAATTAKSRYRRR